MNNNLGIADPVVRILPVMLTVLIYVTQWMPGAAVNALFAIPGALPLTSIFSICPINTVAGYSSGHKFSKQGNSSALEDHLCKDIFYS